MTIRAYAAEKPGTRLEPFEYAPSPAELAPPQVEINISHCGVCHTDHTSSTRIGLHSVLILGRAGNFYGLTSWGDSGRCLTPADMLAERRQQTIIAGWLKLFNK